MNYRVSRRQKIVLRDVQDPREVGRLQKEGGETEEASKASARDSHRLAGTVGSDGARGGGSGSGGDRADSTDGGGWVGSNWGAGVGVDRSSGWGSAGVADHRAGDVDWLADGARAVGDGQSGGLSDSVGLAVVAELRGLRAVGGHLSDDLGRVAHVAIGGSRSGGEGEDRDGRELHVDGRFAWVL